MNLRSLSAHVPTFALLIAPALMAQSGPQPPPPVMVFIREEVKPGKGAAHEATEAAWTQAMIKGKSTNYYLGMEALTGPSEAWFLAGYGSFAKWGGAQNEFDANPDLKKEIARIAEQDGELLSGARTFVGARRKDLSFGPDVEIGKMRYMRVRTFRVKQGQNRPFEDGLKVALEGYAKSRYPFSFATYEVVAGQPSPTFVILRPMKSLGDMDLADAADKAFLEVMGEDGRKALSKVFGDSVQFVENQIFSFNPKLTFAGPSTIASDPAFWAPR
ncbi:hypothetical protein [Geothrix sp. 21YS21S-2]|uniref:hypothetical protein n=1 Tax=Geothrix sp. 21YS21S-2 TaxID=3068893 RepID=UPI0027BA726C|nr:hypothetical protein [Geothrix sp. 21YS21S-2]